MAKELSKQTPNLFEQIKQIDGSGNEYGWQDNWPKHRIIPILENLLV